MKNSRKMLIGLFLALFLVPFIPVGTPAQPVSVFTSPVLTRLAPEPVLPSPEPPHRLVPISILVYTEYADMSVGGEFDNTMTAINNTYGTDYYSTQLTDYSTLGTALPGHDILLIVEQEFANRTISAGIGSAWSTTLTNFVSDGGIVILMDCFGITYGQDGPTMPIFNASGLMDITTIGFYGWGFPVNVVNTSNALARGVASPFAAGDGSVRFEVGDATVVADDGSQAVVAHKVMGQGHVVLLGFDLYAPNADYETLLANAIRLHRHVIFDNSHGQYEDIFGAYSSFADDLVAQNFAVSTYNFFDADTITASDVFVVPYCSMFFTSSQKAFLENYVMQGGGLFLLSDWGSFGDRVGDLANVFGYDFDSSFSVLLDINDNEPPSNDPAQPVYSGANIHNHSSTLAVSDIQMFYGTAITGLPSNAYSIINADTDGTAQWFNATAADGVSCYAASGYGLGRVIVSGDSNFIEDDSDYDSDLTFDYFEHENEDLVVNSIRWLSAAGIKERVVLFDNSHNPISGYEVNTHFLEWAQYMTCNGYTVHWMSTFYASLINQAHILVISEGTGAYTNPEMTTIVNYVAAGGGLFLLVDWGGFGVNVDALGNQFGIDRNDTSYLDDSDDWYIGQSLIIYETANFGSHPIMQGISRIDVDRGTAFDSIGGGTALISSDTDGTCSWNDGGIANGISVFAATQHEQGRVVYITDINFASGIDDPDSDGIPDFYEADNNLFIVNSFQWLSENRAPTVTLTYPNGGEIVNNTITIAWTASDPNGDPILGYDLLYSNDSGASWFPIDTGIMTTSYIWNTTFVPNGSNYLIRVAAYDYELVGIDDSNAVFTIDNPAPLPPPPPIPPLPWWWWIVVLVVVIIIVAVIIVYMFIIRPRGAADK